MSSNSSWRRAADSVGGVKPVNNESLKFGSIGEGMMLARYELLICGSAGGTQTLSMNLSVSLGRVGDSKAKPNRAFRLGAKPLNSALVCRKCFGSVSRCATLAAFNAEAPMDASW